ncbi:hypothetical protein ACE38W_07400 [Chitinophaga sp. Hz27]|uniref:hypothetical protein n=1 Tax=Chitinophaga sp. Hz27 TaxID=3347169 RepID=UPI0035DBD318
MVYFFSDQDFVPDRFFLPLLHPKNALYAYHLPLIKNNANKISVILLKILVLLQRHAGGWIRTVLTGTFLSNETMKAGRGTGTACLEFPIIFHIPFSSADTMRISSFYLWQEIGCNEATLGIVNCLIGFKEL